MGETSEPGWRLSPTDVERVTPFEVLMDRIADDRRASWIDGRRILHSTPELSGQEVRTTAYIADRLRDLGLSVRIPDRGVGVIGEMALGQSGQNTPVIAVRADIDALPLQDRKSAPYASGCPGISHSCGHDAHTTVAIAAAELLTRMSERLPSSDVPSCRFRFIFQAAEETAEGAAWMVEDGALKDVRFILGLHVDPTIPVGKVGIRYGVLTAQVDEVTISVRGRGGHAARPQHTTDPLSAAAMLVTSLYQSVPRSVDALHPTVFTIGTIHGGGASNVVPDQVDMTGTLRSTDRHHRDAAIKKIQSVCGGIGIATGNTISAAFTSPLGSVINDITVMSACEAAAIQVVGGHNLVLIDKPSMGGEDFAVYLEHVRGAQFRLGCAGPGDEWPMLHSPVFDVDERAIPTGARIMARAALMLSLMDSQSVTGTFV